MRKGLLSNFLQKKRIQAVAPFLQGDILDIGCGYSEIIHLLPPTSHYIGVDKNPIAIERMRGKFPNRTFYVLDLECQPLPLENQKFDTIVMLAIIEHLQHPEYIFEQIPIFMKDSANLLITSPTSIAERIHCLGAKLFLFSRLAIEEHQHIYSKDSLNTLLNQFNLVTSEYKKFLLGLNQLWIVRKKVLLYSA